MCNQEITTTSIREFWEKIIEPSKRMDCYFLKYGFERYFECLIVIYSDESQNIVKSYMYLEDINEDIDVDLQCNLDDVTFEEFADGCYNYCITLSKI